MSVLTRFINECRNDWKNQPKKWVDGAINSNVSKYMNSLEEYDKKQEKKDKLLELKNEQLSIFQFERNHFCNMTEGSYERLIELDKQIKQLEEELK